MAEDWRIDLVIGATADALLSVCALQTESTDPRAAYRRAQRALLGSMERAELAGRPRLRDL
jgi:hypothetical protein